MYVVIIWLTSSIFLYFYHNSMWDILWHPWLWLWLKGDRLRFSPMVSSIWEDHLITIIHPSHVRIVLIHYHKFIYVLHSTVFTPCPSMFTGHLIRMDVGEHCNWPYIHPFQTHYFIVTNGFTICLSFWVIKWIKGGFWFCNYLLIVLWIWILLIGLFYHSCIIIIYI